MANEPINEDKIITADDVEVTVEFPNAETSNEDFVTIDLDDLKNLTLPEVAFLAYLKTVACFLFFLVSVPMPFVL